VELSVEIFRWEFMGCGSFWLLLGDAFPWSRLEVESLLSVCDLFAFEFRVLARCGYVNFWSKRVNSGVMAGCGYGNRCKHMDHPVHESNA
jgi:hypothetical protein